MKNNYKGLSFHEQMILDKNRYTFRHVERLYNALNNEGNVVSLDQALMVCLIASINDRGDDIHRDLMNNNHLSSNNLVNE